MAAVNVAIPATTTGEPSTSHLPSTLRWNFAQTIRNYGYSELRREQIRDLQVNLGKLCNQACNHCHVDAGPKRTEIMSWRTMQNLLVWIEDNGIQTVDITGGAPEMNPNFRYFVDGCLERGVRRVISRCNLTILVEPGYEYLAQWYADSKVELVCSLPCYSKENVEAQRGKGIFGKSIAALKLLNSLGYGVKPGLILDLVYNPGGAFLPPSQQVLESEYKRRLLEDFGIQFNQLYTLANLPISRFRHYLEQNGEYESYMNLLADNFNASTVPGLMCRHIISVDWLGRVFDCDFNQMLDIQAGYKGNKYLWDVPAESIVNQKIAVGSHCFGCTAGAGSSCGGAII